MTRAAPDNPDTDDAREGTAAHWVVQRLGARDGYAIGDVAPNGYVIDVDMISHAEAFVAAAGLGAEYECDVSWQATTEVEIRCRADRVVWDAAAQTLRVDDFKFGYRIIDPERNWQLVAAAIGECRRRQITPAHIVLGIYQPRSWHRDGPYRRWVIDFETLVSLHDEIVSVVSELDDRLQTGDHCRHCPGASLGTCPAYLRAAQNAVDVAMRGGPVDFPLDALGAELTVLERAAEMIKDRLAHASDILKTRILAGDRVPGYAVEPALGNSTWKDFKAAQRATNIQLTDEKPVTPAEAKRRGMSEDLLAELTQRPKRGHKLVKRDPDKEARRAMK
jgi:hypothetical protein